MKAAFLICAFGWLIGGFAATIAMASGNFHPSLIYASLGGIPFFIIFIKIAANMEKQENEG